MHTRTITGDFMFHNRFCFLFCSFPLNRQTAFEHQPCKKPRMLLHAILPLAPSSVLLRYNILSRDFTRRREDRWGNAQHAVLFPCRFFFNNYSLRSHFYFLLVLAQTQKTPYIVHSSLYTLRKTSLYQKLQTFSHHWVQHSFI